MTPRHLFYFAITLLFTTSNSNADFTPKITNLGKYQASLFSDGSGSFGTPQQVEYHDNTWNIEIKKDEMTDKPDISAYRMARTKNGGPSSIGLYLSLDAADKETACAFGHDYPGRKAMLRIDKNKPITTNENGCIWLTKNLDSQLRKGAKVTIRAYEWPYDYGITRDVDLSGYTALTNYLRNARSNQ